MKMSIGKRRLSVSLVLLALATMQPAARGQETKPAPPSITPAKETTYFTEPLDDEGYVDILAAVNKLASEGVTPENNAAVLLWQARGPGCLKANLRGEYFAKLGIDVPPVDGAYLVDLYEFDEENYEQLQAQLDVAMREPWKATRFPRLAAWLRENERPLALVVEASQRPKLYEPYVTGPNDGDMPQLMASDLSSVNSYRIMSELLICRAMCHAEQGKLEAVCLDLLTLHRLARHLDNDFTLVHALVGNTIEIKCFKAEGALAAANIFSAEQYRQLQKQLSTVPSLSLPTIRPNDFGERLMFIESLILVARQEAPLSQGHVDWNEALRYGNQWYDRYAAASRHEKLAERLAQVEKIESDWAAIAAELEQGKRTAALLLTWGRDRPKLLGRHHAQKLLAMLTPNLSGFLQSEVQCRQQFELVQLALAVAAYRAEQGKYPAKLEQLVPHEIDKMPVDVYSGKPLIYRTDTNGFTLYSIGVNGIDDGGLGYDDEGENDDLAVRTKIIAKE